MNAVHLTVFGLTDVGRVRPNNEDAFLVADLARNSPIPPTTAPVAVDAGERGVLLAVSDGMGGAQAGEVASALALESLQREMRRQDDVAEVALRESVQRAHEKVWSVACETGRVGMGTTLTAVFIHGQSAYIAEIGDSRAYVLRGHHFLQLTHDQTYVQTLLDSGALTEPQAEACEYKNLLLQALGSQPSVLVALNKLSLHRDDRLILCSDGLTQKVHDDELQNLMAGTSSLRSACAKLVDTANQRGGDDNITVLMADVAGESLPPATEDEISLETVEAYPHVGVGDA